MALYFLPQPGQDIALVGDCKCGQMKREKGYMKWIKVYFLTVKIFKLVTFIDTQTASSSVDLLNDIPMGWPLAS